MDINTMLIEKYTLKVKSATFRYITNSWSGPGWDFDFKCVGEDKKSQSMFPYEANLFTEAAPLPLEKREDMTGIELLLPESYDDVSGEPFFGLTIGETHEISQVTMKLTEKDGNRYLISLEAEVDSTVLGKPAPLKLLAWAERLPDHAYPS